MYRDAEYLSGKKDGIQRIYKDGYLFIESHYKEGLGQGLSITYNESGDIAVISLCKDGNLNGPTIMYRDFAKGIKSCELNYKNSKQDGKTIWYDGNGDVDRIKYYVNGEKVSEKEYKKQNNDE